MDELVERVKKAILSIDATRQFANGEEGFCGTDLSNWEAEVIAQAALYLPTERQFSHYRTFKNTKAFLAVRAALASPHPARPRREGHPPTAGATMTNDELADRLEALDKALSAAGGYQAAVEAAQNLSVVMKLNLPAILSALRADAWQGIESAQEGNSNES